MQLIKDMDGTTAIFEREELKDLRRRLIVSGLDNQHEWIQMLNSAVEEVRAKQVGRVILPAQVMPEYLNDEESEEGVIR